jgi:hypothetical protein
MRLGKYDDISMEKLQHLTNEYGIYVCDSKRIKNLLSNSRELSTFVQTKVETTKIRDLKLDEMKRFFEEELYSTLLISAKFWTRKKLHFIVQSTNCDYADFHVELLEKALQTFYKLLPLDDSKPKEYVIAYLKKTIKNTTMNIINTHTSSKGGRKVNDGKYNFSLIVASENQLGLEQKVVFNEAFAVPCNPIPTFENKISVRQVLDVYQDRDSKYRFLCILLGNYDEQFTKWLKKNNIGKRNETNIEVQDRLDIDLYNRYIGEYLNFGRRHTNRFISSLKNQFGGSPQLIIGGNK